MKKEYLIIALIIVICLLNTLGVVFNTKSINNIVSANNRVVANTKEIKEIKSYCKGYICSCELDTIATETTLIRGNHIYTITTDANGIVKVEINR